MSELPPDPSKKGQRDSEELVQLPFGQVERGEDDAPIFKRRREFVDHEDFSFSPGTLVGSYLHRLENGEMVWEGRVVGEVGPGFYLMELTQSLTGQGRVPVQVLFEIERMLAKDEGYEWRFYDNEETMRAAYAEYVGHTERSER